MDNNFPPVGQSDAQPPADPFPPEVPVDFAAPQPPKKKLPTWAIILIVVGVLLCCCCVAAVAFVVYGVNSGMFDTSGYGMQLMQALA